MTLYQKKRVQNNIKRVDMARMLGLDYNYYCAIEKGEIKMPMNLIDKFSEIINRGKGNKIDEINNKLEADKFWEEMSAKDETGRFELVNKMHDFNINNYKELVTVLGYKSVGTIYNYLEGRNPVGDEFKKRLYNFFSDETNIQIPKKSARVKRATYKIVETPREINPELDEYYNNTDFKKIMRINGITNVQIASAIGVHNSTVANMTCKKYKPSYRIIGAVKDYLDDYLAKLMPEEKANTLNISDEYVSKTALLSKCNDEIAKYQEEIDEYNKKISELANKLELTNKLMDMIKSM
jgi:transcriptional regulator with XRE-family HTH domain